MSIRSAAKAMIIKDDKILLNKCHDKNNGDYYSLPGGGQNKYETLYEALVRECLEETGYTITPIKFVSLCEEICMEENFRQKYPDYAHKMYHIFICEVTDKDMKKPTEKDSMQIDTEWIDISSLKQIKIFPKVLGENIYEVIKNTAPIFLGSEHIYYNHG